MSGEIVENSEVRLERPSLIEPRNMQRVFDKLLLPPVNTPLLPPVKTPHVARPVDELSTSMILQSDQEEHDERQEIGGGREATTPVNRTKRGDPLKPAPQAAQDKYFKGIKPESITPRDYEPYFEHKYDIVQYRYKEYLPRAKSHGSGWAFGNTNGKVSRTLKKKCLGVVFCMKCGLKVRPQTAPSLPSNTLECPMCKSEFLEQIPCRGRRGKPVHQTFLTIDGVTVYLKNEGVHNHPAPPEHYPCIGTQKGGGNKVKKVFMHHSRVGRRKVVKSGERKGVECHDGVVKDRERETEECSQLPTFSVKDLGGQRYEDHLDFETGRRSSELPDATSSRVGLSSETFVEKNACGSVHPTFNFCKQVASQADQDSSHVQPVHTSPQVCHVGEQPVQQYTIPTTVDELEWEENLSDDERLIDSDVESGNSGDSNLTLEDDNAPASYVGNLNHSAVQPQWIEGTPQMLQNSSYTDLFVPSEDERSELITGKDPFWAQYVETMDTAGLFEYLKPGSFIRVPSEDEGSELITGQDTSWAQDFEAMDTDDLQLPPPPS